MKASILVSVKMGMNFPSRCTSLACFMAVVIVLHAGSLYSDLQYTPHVFEIS